MGAGDRARGAKPEPETQRQDVHRLLGSKRLDGKVRGNAWRPRAPKFCPGPEQQCPVQVEPNEAVERSRARCRVRDYSQRPGTFFFFVKSGYCELKKIVNFVCVCMYICIHV